MIKNYKYVTISVILVLILSYFFKQLSHRLVLCFELRTKANGLLVKIIVPLFSISSFILNAKNAKHTDKTFKLSVPNNNLI